MIWTVASNIVLILIMAAGIFYAWRLQRALSSLAKNRQEMEKFVSDFSGSILRAQKAITDLQDTARNAGSDVEAHLTRAQGLRDELSFLIDAADKIATRLSDNASTAQQDAKIARVQRPEKGVAEKSVSEKLVPEKLPSQKPVPDTKELQQQKIAPPIASPVIAQAYNVQPDNTKDKTVPTWIKRADSNAPVINAPVQDAAPVSGLQFGARKPSQKNAEVVAATPAAQDGTNELPRSQAERELLQALEKMK